LNLAKDKKAKEISVKSIPQQMDSSLLSPLTRRGKERVKRLFSRKKRWICCESVASTALPLPYLQTEEKNVTLFSLLQHREKRKKIPLPSFSISRFPLFQLESTIHSTDK
jgi:arginyl-tRNA--protein-N-Asp/Glu arginylyltransferase